MEIIKDLPKNICLTLSGRRSTIVAPRLEPLWRSSRLDSECSTNENAFPGHVTKLSNQNQRNVHNTGQSVDRTEGKQIFLCDVFSFFIFIVKNSFFTKFKTIFLKLTIICGLQSKNNLIFSKHKYTASTYTSQTIVLPRPSEVFLLLDYSLTSSFQPIFDQF